MTVPVLLPTPLASDSLFLGQVLPDPLNPSSVSFRASTAPSHHEPQIQSSYQNVVSHDDHGRLVSSISSSPSSSQDHLLMINAERSEYISLRRPMDAFDALRQDTSAHAFFRRMAQRHQPLYYVVGLQKLRNPTFKRAVVREGSIAEATSNPVPKLRLPMHVRRDSTMDMEASAAEPVFGIEMRKVVCRVGAPEEPHSVEDIPYSWSYHKLDAAGEVQLAIGLGKIVDAAELRALAGIVSDEDLTDDSYASDDSEDGFGGF